MEIGKKVTEREGIGNEAQISLSIRVAAQKKRCGAVIRAGMRVREAFGKEEA